MFFQEYRQKRRINKLSKKMKLFFHKQDKTPADIADFNKAIYEHFHKRK